MNAEVVAALPRSVRELVVDHLAETDRVAPGLIEMLYLTGSTALEDYRSGVSDVDFLALTSWPLGASDLAAVATVHRRMPAAPLYDGVYLECGALDSPPDDCPVVPHVVGGVFHTDRACGELNPVLWLTLTRFGLAVRGPSVADLPVEVDPQRLRRWNLDNLRSYWQPLAGRLRKAMAGPDAGAVAEAAGVVWAVLGPARLHYTLATGEVASKTNAGRYAADHFPAWAELAGRAVRWREGQPVEFVTADARAAAAMVEAVVEDAWQRWG
jgi:hypothetical protein